MGVSEGRDPGEIMKLRLFYILIDEIVKITMQVVIITPG
jgi:hypothetical protein